MLSLFDEVKALEAIEEGNIKQLEKWLKYDPTWIEKPNKQGLYPVFRAAELGHFEMVKYIVEYTRCSMNISDSNNQTCLHYAAKGGNVDLIAYLIDRVTEEPMRANKKGQIPYDLAKVYEREEAVSYFEKRFGTREDLYRNPVLKGFNPDPSIICVGQDFYMVTSTFVYFPAIPVYHSKDLVNWKVIGHGVTNPEYLDLSDFDDGRGIWAPDISHHEGRFYITATLRMNDDKDVIRKQLVVHSDKAEGPYSEPTYIEEDGIDPSIFTDDDGKRYMLLNRGARIFEINTEGSEKLSESELIWYGTNKRAPEAPHVFKKDGYYYCLLAEGGTGVNHQVSIARSKHLYGPYEPCPFNPILKQTNPLDPIQRSGHAKMVKDSSGKWWIAYLCGRMYQDTYTILGRETCIDPVEWTHEGWPIVNQNKGPSSVQFKPKGLDEDKALRSDQTLFDLPWLFVRTPETSKIIRDVHNGYIRFYPDALAVNDKGKKNIMVLKQDQWHFETQMTMRYQHATETCECGMIAYYDTKSFVKFGVIIQNAEPCLFLQEQIGEDNRIQFSGPIGSLTEFDLKMTTQGLKREFYFLSQHKKWELVFTVECADYLSDEGVQLGKRFTGATYGVFGKGEKTNVDFSFDLLAIKTEMID